MGGGVSPEGGLTDLSIQKLEEGYLAFQENLANRIIVAGSKEFSAGLRERYLLNKEDGQRSISLENIIQAIGGKDTIGEAFASRKIAGGLRLKKLLLVTSDKHLERALWIFRRIYGGEFDIEGRGAVCGDLLSEDMERKLLTVTQEFFASLPERIKISDLKGWYEENRELYNGFRQIYKEFYPPQVEKECQAYMSVDYMKERK